MICCCLKQVRAVRRNTTYIFHFSILLLESPCLLLVRNIFTASNAHAHPSNVYVCGLDAHPSYELACQLDGGRGSLSSEMLISAFETGSRISVFQSRASRREREFLSFSLMLRDENKNFCLFSLVFETRKKISFFKSWASRQERE